MAQQLKSGLITAPFLLASIVGTAVAAPLDYAEPPDLTGNLALADAIGALDIGTNRVSGSVDARASGDGDRPTGDDADSFEYVVPAGLLVTSFTINISNYATDRAFTRGRSFSDGVDNFRFSGNVASSNLLEVPFLTSGTYDYQFAIGFDIDFETGFEVGSAEYDWSVTMEVARAITIGGLVSGLETGKQVRLQNNAGNTTSITANGAFAFSTPIVSGGAFDVTVLGQPAQQVCSVTNASGSNVTADVNNVSVTCVPDSDDDGVADAVDDFANAVTSVSTNGVTVTTTLATPTSSCSIDNAVASSFTPPDGFTGVTQQVAFSLSGCDTDAAESVTVTLDFGASLPAGATAFKVNGDGTLTEIPGAAVAGSRVTYTIIDNGTLDADVALGSIDDPVTVGRFGPGGALPVPALPFGGLLTLVFALGFVGLRKAKNRQA